MEQTLADLKACRRDTPKHVMLSDLPPEDQFRKLGMKSKYFIDTIKLIAYRAETAMANIVRQIMSHLDEARSLLRSLYATEADKLRQIALFFGNRSPAPHLRPFRPPLVQGVHFEGRNERIWSTSESYGYELRVIYRPAE